MSVEGSRKRVEVQGGKTIEPPCDDDTRTLPAPSEGRHQEEGGGIKRGINRSENRAYEEVARERGQDDSGADKSSSRRKWQLISFPWEKGKEIQKEQFTSERGRLGQYRQG